MQLSFDTEHLWGRIEKRDLAKYCKMVYISEIRVTGNKLYLGSILTDIASNIQPPKTLILDLFHATPSRDDDSQAIDYLEEISLKNYEKTFRHVFSKWKGRNVAILLCCGKIVLHKFQM